MAEAPAESAAAAAGMESSVAPSPSTQGDIDMQAGESSADSSVVGGSLAAAATVAQVSLLGQIAGDVKSGL